MAVERQSTTNAHSFGSVFDFVGSFQHNAEGTWSDRYGTTVISIGRRLVFQLLQELNRQKQTYSVISSPVIEHEFNSAVDYHRTDGFLKNKKYLISIGAAKEHNIAKELLSNSDVKECPQLITVPLPLTNDSFCTNRSSQCFGRVDVPSRETVYPSRIIIDIDLLGSIDEKLNLAGVGEVIGAYYSIRDYYSIRKLPIPSRLITGVKSSIQSLIFSLRDRRTTWLKQLALNLIAKCLIMRVKRNNQIGAGGDHLLAYSLELIDKKLNNRDARRISHGEFVYLGSLVMAALFPDWEQEFMSLRSMIEVGRSAHLLTKRHVNLLIAASRHQLISMAAQMRPNRPTILTTLLPDQIESRLSTLNTMLRLHVFDR